MPGVAAPELLCPAGDFEKLRFAVRYGADAVYLGGSGFSLRASQESFAGEELARAAAYCHERGARVYYAANALMTNEQADRAGEMLLAARNAGADAVILSDMGAFEAARRLVPDMEIHISTQTGVTNWRAAAALYGWGAKRVILARELSLEDIARIRDKTPPGLELEAFVHGAMCVSFSGRCLLSSVMTGRDANRGGCAQPCRWKYALSDAARPDAAYPIAQDAEGTYILNAKDLCMIEYIDRLAAAGISSLKIEGRAKSAYYAAVTANAYRAALDAYAADPPRYHAPAWAVEETRRVSHRPYGTGFYFGRPDNGQETSFGGYICGWDVVGIVESCSGGVMTLRQRNKFCLGDTLELIGPGQAPRSFTVTHMWNGGGEPIQSAPHAQMAVRISCGLPAGEDWILRRRKEKP